MRRKLMQAAAESVLPSFNIKQVGSLSSGQENRTVNESGTTIVAFRGGKKGDEESQFIVCAADRKTSYGAYSIVSQRSQKIYQLSDSSLFLGAGGVGNIQELRQMLKAQCEEFQELHGVPISVAGQANLLAQWCNIFRRFFEGWQFAFGSILAGVNVDGTMQMYAVDDDGARIEYKNYYAAGSGGDGAKAILDVYWEKKFRDGMDFGIAVDLAVQSIFFAAMRDSGSSDPRIAVPSVSIIHPREGVIRLPKEAVDTILEEFIERHEGEHDREAPEIHLGDLKPRRRKKKSGRKK